MYYQHLKKNKKFISCLRINETDELGDESIQ